MKKILFLFNYLKNIFKKLIPPKPSDEEKNRKKSVLKIILIFFIFSFLIISLIRFTNYASYFNKYSSPPLIAITIAIIFLLLLFLNKHNYLKLSSIFLILALSLPMFYSFLVFGPNTPVAILLAVLIVVISGTLLSAPFALLNTAIISIFLIAMTNCQAKNILAIKDCWCYKPIQISDLFFCFALLIIITGIIWLFCRETSTSLKRAQLSETLLRKERDLLEIKIEKRTKELKEMEMEKINTLYRLAEFGRLSSGIFHDLINPLTAISLNLKQVKADTNIKILKAKTFLNQALVATGWMEKLIANIKNQINQENTIRPFSLNEKINQAIQLLSYKARKTQTTLNFYASRKIKLKGSFIKFSQIITNLLANAIEACENTLTKEVNINMTDSAREVKIIIKDSGVGIAPENINKIFKPFFSTKKLDNRGLGIGLASTKRIIEKDFHGQISVTSVLNQGAIFTIKLPKSNFESL